MGRVSTYRLQFNKTFSLDDAAQIIPFLSDLGITTLCFADFEGNAW